MKKIFLVSLGALVGLSLTACTKDDPKLKEFVENKSGAQVATALVEKYESGEASVVSETEGAQITANGSLDITKDNANASASGNLDFVYNKEKGVKGSFEFKTKSSEGIYTVEDNFKYEAEYDKALDNLYFAETSSEPVIGMCVTGVWAYLNKDSVTTQTLSATNSATDDVYKGAISFIAKYEEAFTADVDGNHLVITIGESASLNAKVSEEIKNQVGVGQDLIKKLESNLNIKIYLNTDFSFAKVESEFDFKLESDVTNMDISAKAGFEFKYGSYTYESIPNRDNFTTIPAEKFFDFNISF